MSRVAHASRRMFDFSRASTSQINRHDFSVFAKLVRDSHSPVLALDVGTRYIGTAVSDARFTVAFAHDAFTRSTFRADIQRLRDIQKEIPFQVAVVGMPIPPKQQQLQLDPRFVVETPLQMFIREYATRLLQQCDVTAIAFWDENFSTVLAKDQFMKRSNKTTRNNLIKRKNSVDSGAAAIILQDCLDAIREH